MSNVPHAEVSPRIVNGVLYFYEGDTFELDIEIDLTDDEDEPVYITSDDIIKTVFKGRSDNVVKEFSVTGIEDNTFTLTFDAATAALFPAGKYTYDIAITRDHRTTLAKNNKVVVE